jgi:nucleotide-binding universal stress UspA family protein
VLLASGARDIDVALRVGTRWAHDLGGTVAACHLVVAPSAADVEGEAAAVRGKVVANAGAAIPVEVLLDATEPRRAILSAAEAGRADVLVVGAPPRALGSVAAALLGSAPCDVLVARRSYAAGPIVVGYDFSEEARAAVSSSTALARRCGTSVVVIHSMEELAHDATAPALARRTEATRAAIAAMVEADIEVRVVADRPEVALLAAERELGARLLVLGARYQSHHAPSSGRCLAAVIAAGATGPVLLVRPTGAPQEDGVRLEYLWA